MKGVTISAGAVIVMATFIMAAHADCDLSKFGMHPTPPAPVRAPPVQDQYAQFEWGTDAYMAEDYWWNWHFIKNDATSAGLTVRWPKANIFIPIAGPLPAGQISCRRSNLGASTVPMPVLDQTAPITYSISNQRQDAVVFVASPQESKPTSLPSTKNLPDLDVSSPPAITQPSLDHSELPSIEEFSTAFQSDGKVELVNLEIQTFFMAYVIQVGKNNSEPNKLEQKSLVPSIAAKVFNNSQIYYHYSQNANTKVKNSKTGMTTNKNLDAYSLNISVDVNNVVLAISDLPRLWTQSQLSEIVRTLSDQGFTVGMLPLAKLISDNDIQELSIPRDVSRNDFLVLSKGKEAFLTYEAPASEKPIRQTVHLIMLRGELPHLTPFAATEIRLTIPDNRHNIPAK